MSDVLVRGLQACASRGGGRCTRSRGYRVQISDRADGSRMTLTFSTLAEAKRWRADTDRAVEQGLRRAGRGRTIEKPGKNPTRAAIGADRPADVGGA